MFLQLGAFGVKTRCGVELGKGVPDIRNYLALRNFTMCLDNTSLLMVGLA